MDDFFIIQFVVVVIVIVIVVFVFVFVLVGTMSLVPSLPMARLNVE